MSAHRRSTGREQTESAFSRILADLVGRVRGARAAALVDLEGETVDYAGLGDPFAVRVAAAHWRIVLKEASARVLSDPPASLAVQTSRLGYVVHAMPEEYAIVLVLGRGIHPHRYRRALSACSYVLAEEAGWTVDPAWYPVEVMSRLGHPIALRSATSPEPIHVIGRYRGGLAWRERAWRIRSVIGLEAMLVREPGGFWYADEPLVEESTNRLTRGRPYIIVPGPH